MKIYLSAKYSRIEEMAEIKKFLEEHNHIVTSRWLDPDQQKNISSAEMAKQDIEDINSSDCLILFNNGECSAGRNVEFGYALAKGLKLFVVGVQTSVFHHLAPQYIPLQNLLEILK